MKGKGCGEQFLLLVFFHLAFSSSNSSLKPELKVRLKMVVLHPKYFMVLAKHC